MLASYRDMECLASSTYTLQSVQVSCSSNFLRLPLTMGAESAIRALQVKCCDFLHTLINLWLCCHRWPFSHN